MVSGIIFPDIDKHKALQEEIEHQRTHRKRHQLRQVGVKARFRDKQVQYPVIQKIGEHVDHTEGDEALPVVFAEHEYRIRFIIKKRTEHIVDRKRQALVAGEKIARRVEEISERGVEHSGQYEPDEFGANYFFYQIH